MVWRGGALVPCTPPHDILDQPVAGFPPRSGGRRRRRPIVARPSPPCGGRPTRSSPPCVPRPAPGSGARGRRRACPRSRSCTGSAGRSSAPSTSSAGSAATPASRCSTFPAPRATWPPTTRAKAHAAVAALERHDFVWVHVEAPDEAGHMGDLHREDHGHRAHRRQGARTHPGVPSAAGRPRPPGPLHAGAHAHARRPAGALHLRGATAPARTVSAIGTTRRAPRRPRASSFPTARP